MKQLRIKNNYHWSLLAGNRTAVTMERMAGNETPLIKKIVIEHPALTYSFHSMGLWDTQRKLQIGWGANLFPGVALLSPMWQFANKWPQDYGFSFCRLKDADVKYCLEFISFLNCMYWLLNTIILNSCWGFFFFFKIASSVMTPLSIAFLNEERKKQRMKLNILQEPGAFNSTATYCTFFIERKYSHSATMPPACILQMWIPQVNSYYTICYICLLNMLAAFSECAGMRGWGTEKVARTTAEREREKGPVDL